MSLSDDHEPYADEDVARLLRPASEPTAPSAAQLARLRAAAHVEWRRALRRRRARGAALLVSLLAATLVLAWALDLQSLFWPSHRPTLVAEVIHVTGELLDIAARSHPNGSPLHPGNRLQAGSVIVTTTGRAALAWHDGTRVRLDTGTRVHLGRDSIGLDAGALYVEIDPGSAQASRLTVTTPQGSVRHVGTRYEVRVQGTLLRVRVREGRVELERSGQLRVAAAGDELSAREGADVAQSPASTYGSEWGWVTAAGAPFRMEGRSAMALLEWAQAEGGWRLEFSDPSIAEVAKRATLHGAIESMSPEDALAVVLPTSGLDYRLEDGRLIVRRFTPG